MDRIRKLKDLPFYIGEWAESELSYYNNYAYLTYVRESKLYNMLKQYEGDFNYYLNDVYTFENEAGNIIIVVDPYSSSDNIAFKEMLDYNNIKYQDYPFDKYF